MAMMLKPSTLWRNLLCGRCSQNQFSSRTSLHTLKTSDMNFKLFPSVCRFVFPSFNGMFRSPQLMGSRQFSMPHSSVFPLVSRLFGVSEIGCRRFTTQCSQTYRYALNSGKTVIPWWFRSRHKLRSCLQSVRHKTNGVEQTVTKARPVKTNELKKLLALAKPEKWKIAVAVCFLLVSSAVSMFVPFSIGRVIDIIYTQISEDEGMVDRLTDMCKVLFGIFIVGGLANFGRVYLMNSAGYRIVKRIRENTFSSIMKQEMAFFDKNKTGELINRLSTDTTIVGESLTANISDGLRASAQAVGGVSMMVYMSPQLTGTALCIVPPVFLASKFYGRYVKGITKQVQDSLAQSTQVAEERIGNMRTVRAFAQEDKEILAYTNKIDSVLNLSYKDALAKGVYWGSTGMFGNMMILSILYYGGLMMTESQITVGELSSFMLYAVFVGVSMSGLISFYSELMRGLGASSRLFQLQDRIPKIPVTDGLIPTQPIKGEIEFRGITFQYPTRPDVSILRKFDLHVPQGQILAVVGPSGSGKSTLASLLLRYYDPEEGSVYVDGLDIKQLSPHWLRANMGIVNQEPTLFSSSIAENIAYGSFTPAEVTKEDIMEAARKANALQFIEKFPDGFDTLVGERGIMLSGGQKQRIAIARAIIKDPKILLLDEATSALDAESEHLVQEALDRIMVNRTVITIAHRLSTIKNAHTIAVLDEGTIKEQGTYEALIQIQDGLFRKLVEKQTIAAI